MTRLNVYAGFAGFYFLRDYVDTGNGHNKINVPSGEYEVALVIQDRMFKENSELFYPSREGDPFYKGFITDMGADIEPGEPSQLAEFFGYFIMKYK